MQYTDFKELKISRLGFGAMRLAMDADGKILPDEVQKMVDYAIAHGINYFDTAYRYHAGESENYFGRALAKHPRESFYLADKLPTWLCETEADVKKIFEEQLEKCGVDYFDFYLFHCVEEDSWDNIVKLNMFDHLRAEKEAGRIRHLGASFHCSAEFLRGILEEYGDDLEFVQLQINYFDWEYDKAYEYYNVAREFDKPIIIMEPVRGGMLANPMSDEARKLLDEAAAEGSACRKADGSGANYAAYALKYCDELPGILTTLSGMSNYEQMVDNINTFNAPVLTAEEKAAIEAAGKALQSDIIIPCTACNYCDECPAGINIPKIFSLYNVAASKGFHNIWGSLSGQYYKLETTASACIQCGACESHCPQKIKIIDELKKIDAKYAHLKEIGE